MRQAPNPEAKGYAPLLLLKPEDVSMGHILGWLHEAREPIWFTSRGRPHCYFMGGAREESGVFCCLGDIESESDKEHHPSRVVTAKGHEEDSYMVASDLVVEALATALSRQPDRKLAIMPAVEGRQLQIWRLNHCLGRITGDPWSHPWSQAVYVTFDFELPHCPSLAEIIRGLVKQRDYAYDQIVKALLGKAQSMLKHARGQGTVK